MDYYQEIRLKDGRTALLRSGRAEDAAAFIDYYNTAHSETDYLTSYPEEGRHDVAAMAGHLETLRRREGAAEICAFVEGRLVASAGFDMVRNRIKTHHRATFGISVIRDFWNLGIGTALTEICIQQARRCGYLQLELDVVAENESAVRLYEKLGFVEYGRNPRAFRTREGQWQTLVLMRNAF